MKSSLRRGEWGAGVCVPGVEQSLYIGELLDLLAHALCGPGRAWSIRAAPAGTGRDAAGHG